MTTEEGDGAFEGAVRVEVRSPVRTTSNAVPFSVACGTEAETESPTGGAPPPPPFRIRRRR